MRTSLICKHLFRIQCKQIYHCLRSLSNFIPASPPSSEQPAAKPLIIFSKEECAFIEKNFNKHDNWYWSPFYFKTGEDCWAACAFEELPEYFKNEIRKMYNQKTEQPKKERIEVEYSITNARNDLINEKAKRIHVLLTTHEIPAEKFHAIKEAIEKILNNY